MTHWATAVSIMATAIFFRIAKIPGISTSPLSTIRSTASPVKMGTYSVSATITAANTRDSPTSSQYFLI